MGMSSGGGGGGTGKGVQSEINVTPLIDVLLVLLIIFLVVMPIMMKMETLEIPRKIEENEMPDPNASMLTVKVAVSGDLSIDENGKVEPVVMADLPRKLGEKLKKLTAGQDKVVFVDFEDEVPWGEVVGTMDQIRSLATDANHDEVKVALKVKEKEEAK